MKNLHHRIGLLAGLTAVMWVTSCSPPLPSDECPQSLTPDERSTAESTDNLPMPVASPDFVRRRLEAAIDHVRQRDVLVSNGFWTVFHSILGLGPSTTLLDDREDSSSKGQRLNAVDYIAGGGEMRGLDFRPKKYRSEIFGLDVINQAEGAGVGQGHQDQFVAEMSQWGMPAEKKFNVFGKDYTFIDFVRFSQMRASVDPKRNQELSWSIIVVGQYLGLDKGDWTNNYGENLSFEKMMRYELDASVEKAACGGTHRLFGLAWVYQLHLQKDGATNGIWQEIADKIGKYRDLAKNYQNPDGTFSTEYFLGPGNSADKQLQIAATGHTLEWLALALPEEELREEWMRRAASALSLQILELQGSSIEGGALYHATHGLLIYYARLYDRTWLGPNDPPVPLPPKRPDAM